MNLKEIKEMINLMNENDLTELEVEKEGSKIKIKKAVAYDVPETVRMPAAPYRIETIPANSPKVSESSPLPANAVKKTAEITSPMVGTFYRAPSPESASFVDVGQMVEIGQVVCIIEAMKLMNEIKSEVRGKVVEVAVSNAEPVEFGQVLFSVEPA